MNKKLVNFLYQTFILSGVSLVLTLGIVYIGDLLSGNPVTGIGDSIYDAAFKARSINKNFTLVKPDDVIIVDIDDESIKELGRVNSWPRLYDARVLNYIAKGQPYVIGVDFLYTEPDSLPAIYHELLSSKGVKNAIDIVRYISTDDSLAEAIRNAQVVYLSMFEGKKEENQSFFGKRKEGLRLLRLPATKNIKYPVLENLTLPIPVLKDNALACGNIIMPTDHDGKLRNYQLLQIIDSLPNDSLELLANFPYYMWSDLIGADLNQATLAGKKLMVLDSLNIPLNKNGGYRINWLGADEKIRHISYYNILNQRVEYEYFKNKFIFLGTSATGMEDLKIVPYTDERTPGVDVHAIAFLNFVNQAYITEISLVRFLPLLLLLIFITNILIKKIRPAYALFVLAALLASEFFITFPIFNSFTLMFPIVPLLIGTIVSGMVALTYNYFTEQKQKKQLKNAFGTYVSSTVVNKIIEDPKSLMLGGTKKTLSVLFSDIRGFTTYSERMDPQLVVSIINKYLSMMSEPVLAHEGTIDKFIGDAIFAIFGAPLENSDHATEACEVALEMILKLKDVNEYLVNEGYGPLKIGIGLNTGEMTIGNIGSEKRFDYTAIGDNVNLGSRIEGLTKHFNVNILASVFTKNSCKQERFLFRALPETRVQGKALTVEIHELMDYSSNRTKYEPYITMWEQAHDAFMNQNFTTALSLFNQYKANYPNDVSTDIYIEKCSRYMEFPEEFSNSIDMDKK